MPTRPEVAAAARRRSATGNRIKMSRELVLKLALALEGTRKNSPAICQRLSGTGLEAGQPAKSQRPERSSTGSDVKGQLGRARESCACRLRQDKAHCDSSQTEVKTTTTTSNENCDFIGHAERGAINAASRSPLSLEEKLISSYEQPAIDWRSASFLSLTLGLPEQIKANAQQIEGQRRRKRPTGSGALLRRRNSCCRQQALRAIAPASQQQATWATTRSTCCCRCCRPFSWRFRRAAYKRQKRRQLQPSNCLLLLLLQPVGALPEELPREATAAPKPIRMPPAKSRPLWRQASRDNKLAALKRQMQMFPAQELGSRQEEKEKQVVFVVETRSKVVFASRQPANSIASSNEETSSNEKDEELSKGTPTPKSVKCLELEVEEQTTKNKTTTTTTTKTKKRNLNASSILQKPYGTNKTNYNKRNVVFADKKPLGNYFHVKLETTTTSKLKTKIRARTRSRQSVIIKQIPLNASGNQLAHFRPSRKWRQTASCRGEELAKVGGGSCQQADLIQPNAADRPLGVNEPPIRRRTGPEAPAPPEECAQGRPNKGAKAGELSSEESNCDIVDRCGRFGQAKRRASWLANLSGSLLCLLLLLSLLLLAGPRQLLQPVSAQSEPDSTSGEELSRAVLATMSTQPPPATLLEPGPNVTTTTGGLARFKPTTGSPTGAFAGSDAAGVDQPLPGKGQLPADVEPENELLERVLSFLRIFIMSAIIIGDICGNSLVILSVCRHSKLRVTTNWFVVSLACADILVALFAMTFNASVIISGRWLFKGWVCDFWNSCDVLASTASILHLCCISIDRYVAIMRPLDYPMKITTRRVMYTLCAVWISSALLSYLPIFTGVYTTSEHIKWLEENPDQCEFVVNRVYAIVSSSISFWIPCCIMIFVYYRIFREATRQEKFIYKAQSMMPAPMANHHHTNHQTGGNNYSKSAANRAKQRRSKSVAVSGTSAGSSEARIKNLAKQQQEMQTKRPPAKPGSEPEPIATTNLTGSSASIPAGTRSASGTSEPGSSGALALPEQRNLLEPTSGGALQAAGSGGGQKPAAIREEEDEEDSNSGQSTPTNRSISKMKREHKAAKTLGIIMGVFILCWLPFFSWYTPTQICGRACDGMVPKQAVTILFWIGYFNSTLNPIIYAYFNHEFRDAFKKTLQWIFCCCNDLKCLRVNRPNDNQHYNCTYRSTQEIGLVNS